MPESATPVRRTRLGKIVSVAIPVAALMTGLWVVYETTQYPRTDDAAVFANFIGIAPQVDGPISRLAVEDNAFVMQGGLLFLALIYLTVNLTVDILYAVVDPRVRLA